MTFIEEFKKPVNFVSILLAVISLAVSIFFYYNGKQFRAVSYTVAPQAIIYDSKNASPAITLRERDSIPIVENVYLLTGTIWNSGNLSISKADVRKQLTINLKYCKRILDYKIVKQFDPVVANFSLQTHKDSLLKIDWQYFDPTFGFNFQIIYIGSENTELVLDGKVLDVSAFNKVPLKEDHRILSIIIIVLYSIMVIYFLWSVFKKKNRSTFFKIVDLIFLLVSISYLTYYVIYEVILYSTPQF